MTAPAPAMATRPKLPPATIWLAAALALLGGIGPNSSITLFGIVVFLFGIALLWRPGESPILLFVFVFQWLQATTKAFNANWLGVDIAELAAGWGDMRLASILSLIGLGMIATGMRLGAGAWSPQDGMIARSSAMRHSPRFWFYLYVASLALATVSLSAAWIIPGLSQPLLAVATLKWAFYFMLVYATFVLPGAQRGYFLVALVAEFVMGVGGFFSDFKSVLFFTAFGLLAAGIRLKAKQYLWIGLLIVISVALGIVWTAVKREYRDFVSGGKESQAVIVPYEQRMTALIDLVLAIDGDKFDKATTALLDRIGYVDYFAAVLQIVPSQMPHENGALWWDAVTRPFMPRLLFPNKPIIDDSERTRQYTGLGVYGSESGASISIGYMGESYIDFGAIGMMVPLLAFGFFLGRLYRWMMNRDPTRLLGMGLATATIYGASFLESSITKVFGGLIVAALVSLLILRYGPRFYPVVERWSGR